MNHLGKLIINSIFILALAYLGMHSYQQIIKCCTTSSERLPQTELELEPKEIIIYNDSEALEHVGKAVYKELGIDKALKMLEHKYIAKEYRPYLGYTSSILRIHAEKKITFKWEF